jgi:hypothetical protein
MSRIVYAALLAPTWLSQRLADSPRISALRGG